MPDFVFPDSVLLPDVNGVGLLGTGSFNGLLWGVGNGITINDITGLHDMPGIQNADHEKPSDHGMYAAFDYLTGRTVTIGFRIIGDSVSDFQNKLNMVMNALVTTKEEQLMTVFNDQRQIMAKCRRRAFQLDPRGELRSITGIVTAEFAASDPRLYDHELSEVSTGLPTESSGVPFPIVFPFTFGVLGNGGQFTINNVGNFETRPFFIINGPISYPIIENVTDGTYLQFGIVLGVSDYLTVDLNSHAVILNGDGSPGAEGSPRRNTLLAGSTWFTCNPGETVINFRALEFEDQASLVARYRSAWV